MRGTWTDSLEEVPLESSPERWKSLQPTAQERQGQARERDGLEQGHRGGPEDSRMQRGRAEAD